MAAVDNYCLTSYHMSPKQMVPSFIQHLFLPSRLQLPPSYPPFIPSFLSFFHLLSPSVPSFPSFLRSFSPSSPFYPSFRLYLLPLLRVLPSSPPFLLLSPIPSHFDSSRFTPSLLSISLSFTSLLAFCCQHLASPMSVDAIPCHKRLLLYRIYFYSKFHIPEGLCQHNIIWQSG